MHFHAGLPRRTGQGSARVLGQPAANTTVQRLAWSIARRYRVQAYSAFQSAGLFRHSSARCCPTLSAAAQRRMHHDRSCEDPSTPAWLCAAALVTATAFLSASAQAGQCPADKMSPGARTSGEMKPKDVTDTVLGHVELAKEKVNLADRRLRLRKLVLQPSGVVPWHSHEDRPAIIYVVLGTINEYASNCSVPIEHKMGEVSVEKMGVQHWWKNTGKNPAVLLSADLFHDDKHADDHMM